MIQTYQRFTNELYMNNTMYLLKLRITRRRIKKCLSISKKGIHLSQFSCRSYIIKNTIKHLYDMNMFLKYCQMYKIFTMLNMCLIYDFLIFFYLKYKLFTIEVEKNRVFLKLKYFILYKFIININISATILEIIRGNCILRIFLHQITNEKLNLFMIFLILHRI